MFILVDNLSKNNIQEEQKIDNKSEILSLNLNNEKILIKNKTDQSNNNLLIIKNNVNTNNLINDSSQYIKNGDLQDFFDKFSSIPKQTVSINKFKKPSDEEFKKSFKNYKNDETESSKFKFLNYIRQILCFICLKANNNLIKEGEGKINYYVDVLTYIQKMQEIDLMKLILFNKDQQNLFDFISKPFVSLVHKDQYPTNGQNEMSDSFNNLEKNDFSANDIKKTFSSYHLLQSKDNKDDVDKNVLNLFRQEIKQFV